MTRDERHGDVIVPGEKIYLGQMRKDLAPEYRRWINDLHVTTTLGVIRDQGFPMTDEHEEDWFESTRKDSSIASFTIYEQGTGKAVGNVALIGVRHPHRNAELGIAIGNRESQGKGYGTEAVRLILDYGFTLLGLHRVWLECIAINHAALRVYERVGFREIGRAREAWQLGAQRHDIVLMDILAREFESPVLKQMLGLDNLA